MRAGDVPAAQLELDLERTRRELAEARIELQKIQDLRAQVSSALAPAKGWGDKITLSAEVLSGPDVKNISVATTWDEIFLSVGPRMAESTLSTASFRTRLCKYIAEKSPLGADQKITISQRQVDKVTFHLRALGVIDINHGYWRLTDDGWQELDSPLVEEVDSDEMASNDIDGNVEK